MNPLRVPKYACTALLALAVSGCLEIETKTTVNTDGTIKREIIMTGDSSETLHWSPFLPFDSTWTMTRRKTGDTSWTACASRVFSDGAELNRALEGTKGKTLQLRIQSGKKFLWFTTEYTYNETILTYSQFNEIPVQKYISQDELDRWFKHEFDKVPYRSLEDSLASTKVEKKADEWQKRNKFEAYFAAFLEGARKLNDPGLTPNRVLASKESLYVQIADYIGSHNSPDSSAAAAERVFKFPGISRVMKANAEGFAEFDRRLKFQDDVLSSSYDRATVIMPGVILETNAPSIDGNTLTWKNFLGYSYIRDYTMSARSRTLNWWAVVLTGGVVVLLAGVLIIGALRRKHVTSV